MPLKMRPVLFIRRARAISEREKNKSREDVYMCVRRVIAKNEPPVYIIVGELNSVHGSSQPVPVRSARECGLSRASSIKFIRCANGIYYTCLHTGPLRCDCNSFESLLFNNSDIHFPADGWSFK